jgi:hypothetical protein
VFIQLNRDEVALSVAEALKKMKPFSAGSNEVTKKKAGIAPSTSIPRPPPKPFSGVSSADASALRSSIGLLQMQKAQTLEDIRVLEESKRLALEDPEAYVEAVKRGDLRPAMSTGKVIPDLINSASSGEEREDAADGQQQTEDSLRPRFPPLPAPQNIVQMPAINWAKYGIVGDALDKMHEEQRTNPTLGAPEIMASRSAQPTPLDLNQPSSEKAPRHYLAKPYNPLDQK